MAHAQPKLHEVFEADRTAVAGEGLQIIGGLYQIERASTVRHHGWRTRWTSSHGLTPSSQSVISYPLVGALRYAVKLKLELLVDTTDGRLEFDNAPAENGLGGIARGRKQ